MDDPLRFRSIELPRDGSASGSDLYSFIGLEQFERQCGADGESYLAGLAGWTADFPAGFVHVWRGGEIVGQIELRLRSTRTEGYVNLFYLIPEARGSGVSAALHEYMLLVFADLGVRMVELRVSPGNGRALGYYGKHGWQDRGPDPEHSEVHRMELRLGGSRGALGPMLVI